MHVLEAALSYADRGWSVFPLADNKKRPLNGSRGFKDAVTDESQIRKWCSAMPNMNLGIATGEVSNIFIVDIDVKAHPNTGVLPHGDRHWASLVAKHGCPDTLTCRTPSGGWHLYFQMPTDVDIGNSQSRVARGIDIRGTGGYVVAPPSMVDGRSYRCLSAPSIRTSIVIAPAWLVERVLKVTRSHYKVSLKHQERNRSRHLVRVGEPPAVMSMREYARDRAYFSSGR